MNAKYFGKHICKNEKGDVIHILAPTVLVSMNVKEFSKFEKMMKWISENRYEFIHSEIKEDNRISAYIEVSDSQEGAEFLMYYKEAKSAIK